MGPFRGAETHARSVLKAISWRTMGTLDTFAISWFMTGKVVIAGSIAGLEVITKIAWYYLHERVWAGISWGRGNLELSTDNLPATKTCPDRIGTIASFNGAVRKLFPVFRMRVGR
jgi:uncharacterized membrane protein